MRDGSQERMESSELIEEMEVEGKRLGVVDTGDGDTTIGPAKGLFSKVLASPTSGNESTNDPKVSSSIPLEWETTTEDDKGGESIEEAGIVKSMTRGAIDDEGICASGESSTGEETVEEVESEGTGEGGA